MSTTTAAAAPAQQPGFRSSLRAGPSLRATTFIIVAIVVVLLGVIIAQGFVTNGIVQGTSNSSLQGAISIIAIIITIILWLILIYVAYAVGRSSRTCAQ